MMRQLAQEPALGKLPVPHHRLRRDGENASRLVDRQPTEMSQFHYPGLPLVNRGKRLQRVVESDEIVRRGRRRCQILVECDMQCPATALPKGARAAYSTRIRRINRAAMAKKCVRLRH